MNFNWMKARILALLFAFNFCVFTSLKSQEKSLLDGVVDTTPKVEKISGAFKSSRVIHAHSVEMVHKNNLDFRILHRFGLVSDGIKELFGLDQASMRLGLDYGLTDNLTAGFGRSTFKKEYDAFLKYRIFQQSTGAKNIPVSLIVVGGAMIRSIDELSADGVYKLQAGDKTSYYVQTIIGRKFNDKFSLQLSPIYLHMNYVDAKNLDNDLFAVGGGARYKLSKHLALTMDYHHVFGSRPTGTYDPLAIGVDIETGGHVFQLHFSNAQGMNERAFLYETTDQFFKGEIRFGFNLSRMFNLNK